MLEKTSDPAREISQPQSDFTSVKFGDGLRAILGGILHGPEAHACRHLFRNVVGFLPCLDAVREMGFIVSDSDQISYQKAKRSPLHLVAPGDVIFPIGARLANFHSAIGYCSGDDGKEYQVMQSEIVCYRPDRRVVAYVAWVEGLDELGNVLSLAPLARPDDVVGVLNQGR